MKFQPGQSGNPAGRPLGARNKKTLVFEAAYEDKAEEAVRDIMERAKGGQPAAMRLCMERAVPAGRHRRLAFALPPVKSPEGAEAAIEAVMEGHILRHARRATGPGRRCRRGPGPRSGHGRQPGGSRRWGGGRRRCSRAPVFSCKSRRRRGCRSDRGHRRTSGTDRRGRQLPASRRPRLPGARGSTGAAAARGRVGRGAKGDERLYSPVNQETRRAVERSPAHADGPPASADRGPRPQAKAA
jgi:hypothetical protein